jgi:hypothetical protein
MTDKKDKQQDASEPEEIPFDQKKLDEGGWKVNIYHKDSSHHNAEITGG